MKLRSATMMRIAKYSYIVISAVFCLAGLLIVLLPAPSASAVGVFLGVAMLVFGIIKLIGYFSKDLFRLAFEYDLQFGILLSLLGIMTLIRRENVVEFICIAYGVCMIADCLFKSKTAFEARRFGIRQWWLTLLCAVTAGIAGVMVAVSPAFAIGLVKLLLGISLMAEGILGLSVAISMVKIIDHQKPDVIDVEYYEVQEEETCDFQKRS